MVTPTDQHPMGDISLSDGTTTVYLQLANTRGEPDSRAIRRTGMPRTSMQMTTGDPDYGSFVLPYIPIVQKDFSGGRGQEDFTADATRYYDSYNVDTRNGDVLLGPAELTTAGSGLHVESAAATSDTLAEGYNKYVYASSFVATSERIEHIKVWVKRGGSATTFSVGLRSDNAGAPGSQYQLVHTESFTGSGSWEYHTIAYNYPLVIGTTYWLVIIFYDLSDGTKISDAAGKSLYSGLTTSSMSLQASNKELYYVIYQSGNGNVHLFEYKRSMFGLWNFKTGAVPRLYINDYHGMALDNSTDKSKLNTTLSLSDVDLTGCIAQLVSGPGSEEAQNWRKITGNNATAITVYPPWNITHTTATEYAILGVNTWTEITGTSSPSDATNIKDMNTNLTGYVTDLLIVDDIIYICQGDKAKIVRISFDSTTGKWKDSATEDDIDTTYKGVTFLDLIPDTTGKRRVWYAQATTSKVSSSEVKTWGNKLVWKQAHASAIVCGNARNKITNLLGYGQPRIPYIMKEDSFGCINQNIYAEVPLSEMNYVRSEENGRAACQWGVYLFFSLLDGVERYYDNRLDDVGPNKDEGFPTTRKGPIMDMIPYPGGIYACIDGGSQGYSSILFWNQTGWHEIYRGEIGQRIQHMYIQVIPGTTVDRLWFNYDNRVCCLPCSSVPRKQSDYSWFSTSQWADTGYIITSWFKTQFAEIVKFWKSITLFTENLTTTQSIYIYYQTDTEDDDDAWNAISGDVITSPIYEKDISTTHTVTGKRIRFKLVFRTTSTTISPRLKALTVNAVCRVPQKDSYSITFFAESAMRDMNGRSQSLTLAQLNSKLLEWADSNQRAAPLLARFHLPEMDGTAGQYVFIDPPNINPVYLQLADGRRIIKYVGTMVLYEA